MLVWEVLGGGADSLRRIITSHQEHIESTTKGPLKEKSAGTNLTSSLIISEEQKVRLVLVK